MLSLRLLTAEIVAILIGKPFHERLHRVRFYAGLNHDALVRRAETKLDAVHRSVRQRADRELKTIQTTVARAKAREHGLRDLNLVA